MKNDLRLQIMAAHLQAKQIRNKKLFDNKERLLDYYNKNKLNEYENELEKNILMASLGIK